jgi:hypothetical protein
MTLVDDLRGSLRESEPARVQSLRRLYDTLVEAERADVDRREFSELFSSAMKILELDQEPVARLLKASRPTISRWAAGLSAPHPLARPTVFRELRKVAADRLRQHESAETVSS